MIHYHNNSPLPHLPLVFEVPHQDAHEPHEVVHEAVLVFDGDLQGLPGGVIRERSTNEPMTTHKDRGDQAQRGQDAAHRSAQPAELSRPTNQLGKSPFSLDPTEVNLNTSVNLYLVIYLLFLSLSLSFSLFPPFSPSLSLSLPLCSPLCSPHPELVHSNSNTSSQRGLRVLCITDDRCSFPPSLKMTRGSDVFPLSIANSSWAWCTQRRPEGGTRVRKETRAEGQRGEGRDTWRETEADRQRDSDEARETGREIRHVRQGRRIQLPFLVGYIQATEVLGQREAEGRIHMCHPKCGLRSLAATGRNRIPGRRILPQLVTDFAQ